MHPFTAWGQAGASLADRAGVQRCITGTKLPVSLRIPGVLVAVLDICDVPLLGRVPQSYRLYPHTILPLVVNIHPDDGVLF